MCSVGSRATFNQHFVIAQDLGKEIQYMMFPFRAIFASITDQEEVARQNVLT